MIQSRLPKGTARDASPATDVARRLGFGSSVLSMWVRFQEFPLTVQTEKPRTPGDLGGQTNVLRPELSRLRENKWRLTFLCKCKYFKYQVKTNKLINIPCSSLSLSHI